MKVLVVGSGSREKSLIWHLENSPTVDNVIVSPADISIETLKELAKNVGLVVIGPEQPLADGLADALRSVCTPVFGPNADGAKLESSKIYARDFMTRNNVNCPKYIALESYNRIPKLRNPNVVVKVDGLAGGKGVWTCQTQEEVEASVKVARTLGEGRCLIEERIYGREYSFYILTDGKQHISLPVCRDYKKEYENEEGSNTGGMGAICPAPDFPQADVITQIVNPTLKGIKDENIFYRGVIYFGIMVDDFGKVYCLEYNCRFGDPECQALVRAIDADLTPVMVATATGNTPNGPHVRAAQSAACVVLASEDYPRNVKTGQRIYGLEEAATIEDVVLFEGALSFVEGFEGMKYTTDGGRVISVTGAGSDMKSAVNKAYEGVDKITFKHKKYRKDVGS